MLCANMDSNPPESFRAPKRANDPQFARTGRHESPDHTEFVRTQTQLMQTMLKAMILASGWRDEGHPGGSR